MGLSIKDCVKGTIVDWTYKYDPDERAEELRPVRRRGIIRRVVGTNDAIAEVWVQFRGDKLENVAPRELVRVFPYNSKPARRALAALEGTAGGVGSEFEDGLALTPRVKQAVVEPEYDNPDPMIESQGEPIVIPDTEDETKD
jgi:hypothetical protein